MLPAPKYAPVSAYCQYALTVLSAYIQQKAVRVEFKQADRYEFMHYSTSNSNTTLYYLANALKLFSELGGQTVLRGWSHGPPVCAGASDLPGRGALG